eukprot:3621597-Amphidinium_carterae.1
MKVKQASRTANKEAGKGNLAEWSVYPARRCSAIGRMAAPLCSVLSCCSERLMSNARLEVRRGHV